MAVGFVLFTLGALPAGADSSMNDQTKADNPPIHTVYFGFGDDSVSSAEQQRIDQAVELLSTDNGPLVVRGFTDSIGLQAYNDDLAQRRSEAVRKALVAQGIAAARIETAWTGRSDYVADNRKEATRRLNRRVEIRPAARQLQVVGPDLPHPADEYLALSAKDRLRVGRYSQLTPIPRPGQANPLQTIVSLIFPGQIRTVGAALNHVLARSGWTLAPTHASDPTIPHLLNLPLPESQRSLGPIALFDALAVLCGEAYVIVVDPVNRLVSCELRAPYSSLSRVEEGVPAPYADPKADH
jgi:conjugative transfer region protein (TIGR03748 family)